ncbi:hypothetical protein SAMN04488513_11823 [Pseudozobellia thermophila]|uniref:Uncharacterized protein n=1 Tax=Pseudozobellia thermophila TaxID=192903 RepID=A0A1M6P5W5_9FLAO|nr:hypothetical protein SAMN04488513_11823 [Pseudozobellia thermophila]
MILIDKIFIKIYFAYKNRFNSDTPTMYSVSYLVIMLSMHIMAILKILELLGADIHTEQYSKSQKISFFLLLYLVFSIRYYYFFDPVKFSEKHDFSENYKPIIIYTVVFFISFWVLILAF